MAWITDSLRTAVAAAGRLNPFGRQDAALGAPGAFTHQLAVAAYLSSGLLRKVIAIPADDRAREWRDWQAEKDDVELIEAEERRLGLRAKIKQAEVLRGIGGGALILVTPGDHAQPLDPAAIAKGQLVAVNVASRWEVTPKDFDTNLASPTYRQPRMFEVEGRGGQQQIHPSRVICFRGEPVPAGAAINDVEAFWGDCRLTRVFCEVQRSDETQAWFSALVKKAKLLRFGIPNLTDFTATADGKKKLDSRIALIAEGESTLNAVVYDAGNGRDSDSGGEKITDYQITWAGIPAVMDAFDQRVAAVADIPFTRLMGRSPAGMNATGQHDMDNWNRAVASGQSLELRPCLEHLDPILLRSAGVSAPDDVTWRFAPLWTPTEKEQADTFKVEMEAVTALQNTGAIPDQAFAKGVQNLLSEREYLPGLDQALAEIPEDERFGIEPDDDGTDPSSLQAERNGDPTSAGAGGDDRGSGSPARRAANDKAEVGDKPRSPFDDGYNPRQPRGRDGRWVGGAVLFIRAALGLEPPVKGIPIAKPTKAVRDRLKALGVHAEPKSVGLDASAVKHIIARHGRDHRGQKPIDESDIAKAGRILNRGSITRGTPPVSHNGAPTLFVRAWLDGHDYEAVYEVRKYRIVPTSMRKR